MASECKGGSLRLKCPNCNNQLNEGTNFCPYCGTDVYEVMRVAELNSNPYQSRKKLSIGAKIGIVFIAIMVVISSGTLIKEKIKENKQNKYLARVQDIVDTAFKAASRGNKELSVSVAIESKFSVSSSEGAGEGSYKNTADIDFRDSEVNLSNGISEYRYWLDDAFSPIQGQDDHYNIYSDEGITPWRQKGDQSWEEMSYNCVSLEDYTWFFDEIYKEQENLQLNSEGIGSNFKDGDAKDEKDNYLYRDIKGEIVLTGTLHDAAAIGDSYLKLMDYADFEPSAGSIDNLSYELKIDKATKKITSITFSMGDFARYAVYGNDGDDSLRTGGSGTYTITYNSFDTANDFSMPAEVSNKIGEASGEPQDEAQDERQAAQSEPEEVQPAEETIYTITENTLCTRELKDFFQYFFGARVNHAFGNTDVCATNVSELRNGLIDKLYLDSDLHVAEDYNDEAFQLDMHNINIKSSLKNKSNVSYRCSVSCLESNLPNGSFNYYEGTDAKVSLVVKLEYYIDDEQINKSNQNITDSYAVVVLKNDPANPDNWLLISAISMTGLDYEKVEGKCYDTFLVNEDEQKEVEADYNELAEWKKIYIEYFNDTDNYPNVDSFNIVNINSDEAPEIICCYENNSNLCTYAYFIDTAGDVKKTDATFLYDDTYRDNYIKWIIVHDDGSSLRRVYRWNSDQGTYDEIFSEYENIDEIPQYVIEEYDSDGWLISERECSKEEYDDGFNTSLGDSKVIEPDVTKYNIDDLIQVITDYQD